MVMMEKKKQTERQTIYKQFNKSKNDFLPKINFFFVILKVTNIHLRHLHSCFLTQTQWSSANSIHTQEQSDSKAKLLACCFWHANTDLWDSSERTLFSFHCKSWSFLAPPLCSAVFEPDLSTEQQSWLLQDRSEHAHVNGADEHCNGMELMLETQKTAISSKNVI